MTKRLTIFFLSERKDDLPTYGEKFRHQSAF